MDIEGRNLERLHDNGPVRAQVTVQITKPGPIEWETRHEVRHRQIRQSFREPAYRFTRENKNWPQPFPEHCLCEAKEEGLHSSLLPRSEVKQLNNDGA